MPTATVGVVEPRAMVKGYVSIVERLERAADGLANLNPQQIDEALERAEDSEYEKWKDLRASGVSQMSPVEKSDPRFEPVWWSEVAVVPLPDGFWGVDLDGAPVIAWKSSARHRLVLPSEAWALMVAAEYAAQQSNPPPPSATPGADPAAPVVDTATMPLCDLASAALLVGKRGVRERLDFFPHALASDKLLFRDVALPRAVDAEMDSACAWFDRMFNVVTPRAVGVAAGVGASVGPDVAHAVRVGLAERVPNKYVLIGLHVLARYLGSVVLACATAWGAVTPAAAMRLGNAEEDFAAARHGVVPGYHDSRRAELAVKVAAACFAVRASAGLSADACEPPAALLLSARASMAAVDSGLRARGGMASS